MSRSIPAPGSNGLQILLMRVSCCLDFVLICRRFFCVCPPMVTFLQVVSALAREIEVIDFSVGEAAPTQYVGSRQRPGFPHSHRLHLFDPGLLFIWHNTCSALERGNYDVQNSIHRNSRSRTRSLRRR